MTFDTFRPPIPGVSATRWGCSAGAWGYIRGGIRDGGVTWVTLGGGGERRGSSRVVLPHFLSSGPAGGDPEVHGPVPAAGADGPFVSAVAAPDIGVPGVAAALGASGTAERHGSAETSVGTPLDRGSAHGRADGHASTAEFAGSADGVRTAVHSSMIAHASPPYGHTSHNDVGRLKVRFYNLEMNCRSCVRCSIKTSCGWAPKNSTACNYTQ